MFAQLSLFGRRSKIEPSCLLRAAVAAVVASTLVVGGALLLLQTRAAATWVANTAAQWAIPAGSRMTIGRADGNWITWLELHDVAYQGPEGRTTVRMDTARVRYRPLRSIFSRTLRVDEVRLSAPVVALKPDTVRAAGGGSAPNDGDLPGRWNMIAIQRVTIDGGQLTAAYGLTPRDSNLRVEDVAFSAAHVRLGPTSAVTVDSLRFRFLPAGADGEWATVQVRGSLSEGRLTLDELTVRSPASDVTGSGTVVFANFESDPIEYMEFRLTAAPLAYRDLRPFVRGFDQEGSVELLLIVSGPPRRPTVDLDARFSDGATVRVAGAVTLAHEGPFVARLDAEARDLNPALLSGNPTLAGAITADVAVALSGPRRDQASGSVRVTVHESAAGWLSVDHARLQGDFVEGRARFELDGEGNDMELEGAGWLRPFDDAPGYDATVHVTRVPAVWRGLFEPGDVSGSVRIRNDERHRFTATLRAGNGTVEVDGDVTLGDRIAYRVVRAVIRRIDAASFLGDTVASAVTGSFTLEGTGTDPNTLAVTMRADFERSVYGPHELGGATVTASLRRGRAAYTADALLDGAAIHLRGWGTPLAPVPTMTIDSVTFANLDPGRLLDRKSLGGSLGGRAAVRSTGQMLDALAHLRRGEAITDAASLSLTARLEIDSVSRFRGRALGADAGIALADGELQFQAGLALARGRIRVAGAGRPFDTSPTVAIERGGIEEFDLATLLDGVPTTSINATVVGRARGQRLDELWSSANAEVHESHVAGVRIAGGRIAAVYDVGRVETEVHLASEIGNGTLSANARLLDERPPFEVELSGTLESLGPLVRDEALRGGVEIRAGLTGAGLHPATMAARGFVEAWGPFAGANLDSLRGAFSVVDGILELDTLVLRADVGEVSGAGRVALFSERGGTESNLMVVGSTGDGEALSQVVRTDLFAVRSGDFRVSVRGVGGDLMVEASSTASGLGWRNSYASHLEVEGAATLAPPRHVREFAGEVRLSRGFLGRVPIRQAVARGSYNDTNHVALDLTAQLDDERDIRVVARADPRPAVRQIRLEDLTARVRDRRWTLDHPVSIAYGSGIVIDDFSLRAGTGRIAIDGMLARDGEQDLSVRIDSLRLGPITDLLGLGAMDGDASAVATLTGAAHSPVLGVRAEMATRSPTGETARAIAVVSWEMERLAVTGTLAVAAGDSLTLDATLPLALTLAPPDTAPGRYVHFTDGAVDVTMTTVAFPLEPLDMFVAPTVATHLGGRLSLDARIAGTLAAPRLGGSVTISHGRARIPSLGVTYENIDLGTVLRGDSIIVEQLRLASEKDGSLAASGHLTLDGIDVGAMDLRGTLTRLWLIRTASYRARASGDLRLAGSVRRPVLTGSLRLSDTEIFVTPSNVTTDVEAVQLTADDYVMLEGVFGPDVQDRFGAAAATSFVDAAIRIAITLDQRVWLRRPTNPKMAVEFTGSGEIRKEAGGEVQLFGAVQPRPGRSYVQQFGRRFVLTRGEITFTGDPDSLYLDIEAAYEVPRRSSGETGVTITMGVTGGFEQLRLTFSSEPAMEEVDIISYIATGRPAGQSFQVREAATSTGLELAFERVAGAVERVAEEGVGLDVVEIRTEGFRGATLVAGRYVTSDVFVAFRQPISFKGDANDVSGAGQQPEFELEYEAFRWLMVNLQGGTDRVRVFLRSSHAY